MQVKWSGQTHHLRPISETPEVGNEDDGGDIDVSLKIDASTDDVEAMMDTTVTSFDPGDTLGKLLMFVN